MVVYANLDGWLNDHFKPLRGLSYFFPPLTLICVLWLAVYPGWQQPAAAAVPEIKLNILDLNELFAALKSFRLLRRKKTCFKLRQKYRVPFSLNYQEKEAEQTNRSGGLTPAPIPNPIFLFEN